MAGEAKTSPPKVGLIRIGNGCYYNSAIIALYSVKEFKQVKPESLLVVYKPPSMVIDELPYTKKGGKPWSSDNAQECVTDFMNTLFANLSITMARELKSIFGLIYHFQKNGQTQGGFFLHLTRNGEHSIQHMIDSYLVENDVKFLVLPKALIVHVSENGTDSKGLGTLSILVKEGIQRPIIVKYSLCSSAPQQDHVRVKTLIYVRDSESVFEDQSRLIKEDDFEVINVSCDTTIDMKEEKSNCILAVMEHSSSGLKSLIYKFMTNNISTKMRLGYVYTFNVSPDKLLRKTSLVVQSASIFLSIYPFERL